MVGWYEYSRALSLLDPLVNAASAEELQVIDDIIRERDEFAIYTNLSRRLETAPTSLSETAHAGAVERRGLAWMMALARVELGAMAAGFTDHPEPFALFPPSRYESEAFMEILLDGARTHMLAMRNDPVVQYYASMRGRSVSVAEAVHGPAGRGNALSAAANEQWGIAYARRVVIADEFVQAAGKFGAAALAPVQQAELAAYREQLRSLEDVLLYKVLGLGGNEVASSSTKTTHVKRGPSGFGACPRLMQIARRDIAAGRHRLESPVESRGTETTVRTTRN